MRTGWENLSDVFMQIGSQYRENKQREYDREHQLEMLRMQLLNAAEEAKAQRDFEASERMKDRARSLENLRMQLEATSDENEKYQKFLKKQDLIKQSFDMLDRMQTEGGLDWRAQLTADTQKELEQMRIDAGAYANRNIVDYRQQQQDELKGFKGQIETEALNMYPSLADKGLSFKEFQKQFPQYALDEVEPWQWKMMKQNPEIAMRYLRKQVAQYIVGMAEGDYPEIGGYLSNYLQPVNFGEEPEAEPTMTETIKEKIGYESPTGGWLPGPFGVPMPGRRYIEKGIQKAIGPFIKDKTEGYDYEITNPFGGMPPEAGAEEGPMPGETKEDWLDRIMKAFKRKR